MQRRSFYIVAAAAIALAGGAAIWLHWSVSEPVQRPKSVSPSADSLSSLKVFQQPDGRWAASFTYVNSGAAPATFLRVYLGTTGQSISGVTGPVQEMVAQRGTHEVTWVLRRPPGQDVTVTDSVLVQMEARGYPVQSQEVSQRIEWPPAWNYDLLAEMSQKSPAQNLQVAVDRIDSGHDEMLAMAKFSLERLIEQDPRFDAAYVELARVAMKTNWGPEGLHHAETLLDSALQLRPDSDNARILQGYVYTHQRRFGEAEAMFRSVQNAEIPNLWLWVNWGELLEFQGKPDAAVDKYKRAIQHPPAQDTYDRARRQAFRFLMRLMERRGDVAALEALHRQRSADYPASECYGVQYARFVLRDASRAGEAMQLALQSEQGGCKDAGAVRSVRGVAQYVLWGNERGAQRAELLRQARVYMAAGPTLYVMLASSDSTAQVMQQLVAEGEKIDQQDNARMTALAYALRDQDHASARRLLKAGARPDTPVGPEGMPVSLVPLLTRDLDGIKLMQRAGVDYAKVRFRDMTGIEIARSLQDRRLYDAVAGKAAGTSL